MSKTTTYLLESPEGDPLGSVKTSKGMAHAARVFEARGAGCGWIREKGATWSRRYWRSGSLGGVRGDRARALGDGKARAMTNAELAAEILSLAERVLSAADDAHKPATLLVRQAPSPVMAESETGATERDLARAERAELLIASQALRDTAQRVLDASLVAKHKCGIHA